MDGQDTIQISFGDPICSYQLADVLPQRFGPGGYPASAACMSKVTYRADVSCQKYVSSVVVLGDFLA